MKRRASVLILFGLALPAAAHAQEAPSADDLLKAILKGRDVLAASASREDARIIRDVTFRVAPNLITDHGAWSLLTPDGRQVVISQSLMYEMGQVAETQYVSRVFPSIPNLTTSYFRHFNESYLYQGYPQLSIEDYTFMDAANRARFRSPEVRRLLEGWLEHALIFVIAHELGHHARNALYTASDSSAVMQEKERAADRWAAEAMIAAGLSPIQGVILVTEWLELMEHLHPATTLRSHPPTPDRALDLMTRYREQQRRLYATPRYAAVSLDVYAKMEEQWASELTEMQKRRAARTISKLSQQADAGDVDAQESLAYIYLYGLGVQRDSKKAAPYLEAAAENGEFSAQANLGVLYMNGALGAPDFGKAQYWCGLAAIAGEKMSMANLTILAKMAPKAKLCAGECMLRESRTVLGACIEEQRARCVDACTSKYGHSRDQCVSRFCGNLSDQRRYFAACYEPLTANQQQACAKSCEDSGPSGRPSCGAPGKPLDDTSTFGGALRAVVDSARAGFSTVAGTAQRREADDTSITLRTKVPLPTMTHCRIEKDDDAEVVPAYVCDRYSGASEEAAGEAYRTLVGLIDRELGRPGEAGCKESIRVPREGVKVTRCQHSLDTGVVVHAEARRRAGAKGVSFSVKLSVDAPEVASTEP